MYKQDFFFLNMKKGDGVIRGKGNIKLIGKVDNKLKIFISWENGSKNLSHSFLGIEERWHDGLNSSRCLRETFNTKNWDAG